MSSLAELSAMMQDTTAMIALTERAVVETPESRSVTSSLRSLAKRQTDLARWFTEETERLGVDACAYRLFGGDEPVSVAALTNVLGRFQTLLSVTYSAVKSGQQRVRGRVGAGVVNETTLRFGYSFPGSVGIMLTLPHNRPLLGPSKLDESVKALFDLAAAKSPDEIADFARQLGPAPVRAAYKWSVAHAEARLGVAIDWTGQTSDIHLRLQERELERLRESIDAAPAQEVEEAIFLSGILTRISSEHPRTFRLKFDNDSHLNGKLADDLTLDPPAMIPARYTAHLLKRTVTRYAAEFDVTDWVLTGLAPA